MRKVTWAAKMEIVGFYLLCTVCYLKTDVLLWVFFGFFFAFDMLVETWVCMYASVSVCICSVLS